jgi:hypothetical protein
VDGHKTGGQLTRSVKDLESDIHNLQKAIEGWKHRFRVTRILVSHALHDMSTQSGDRNDAAIVIMNATYGYVSKEEVR